jgi:tetratricopeptide (TPR) repeat protein
VRAELAIMLALLLGACGSTPKQVDPPRLRAALEAESDGAKRYERGDYVVAARRFAEAAKLHASIDDATGVARNRLHLARSDLVQGRDEAALALLDATDAAGDPGFALDIRMLKAQALLGLGRTDEVRNSLAEAAALCAGACPRAASLHLLQARHALADKRPADALAHADAALKLLQGKDEAAEIGNAWRLIAAARQARGDGAGGLVAARAALDIDRRLALPEKIARDWLLIGDIQRAQAATGAATAYRKALAVAQAAGLDAITMIAAQALQDIGMQKKVD